MTTTAIDKRPRGGLSTASRAARDIHQRIERAWQSRNAKVERADTEYMEVVRSAMAPPEADEPATDNQSAEHQQPTT